jgi:hypothetical protein
MGPWQEKRAYKKNQHNPRYTAILLLQTSSSNILPSESSISPYLYRYSAHTLHKHHRKHFPPPKAFKHKKGHPKVAPERRE